MNLILVLFIISILFAIYGAVGKHRKITGLENKKIFLYTIIEMSFIHDNTDEILSLLKDKKKFNLPIKAIFIGIFGNVIYSLKNLNTLISTSIFIALITYLMMSIEFYKILQIKNDSMVSMYFVYFGIIITWLLFYYKSVANSFSYANNKFIFVKEMINDKNSLNNIDEIDNLIEQCKIDFDLYKYNNSLGSFGAITILVFIFYYFKFSTHLLFTESLLILVFFGSLLIFNFFYKRYRSRIIYIALQSLLLYKEEQITKESSQ